MWELVKGMDVLDYLNSLGGVMSEPEARGFFRQLLSGIRCIHDNGFCHRDIKPENCMIETSTGTLKIIDFGLSKHLDSAKTLGIGTPDYMAPEMLSQGGDAAAGSRSYDPAAVDVWAMGVMLYLILTGTYPFEDLKQPGNVTATLRRVKEGRMNPLPANLGSEVRDLLARMIRADPRARIRLAAVAAHPWITAADDGVGERPPGVDPEATVAASTCRSVPAGDAWVGERRRGSRASTSPGRRRGADGDGARRRRRGRGGGRRRDLRGAHDFEVLRRRVVGRTPRHAAVDVFGRGAWTRARSAKTDEARGSRRDEETKALKNRREDEGGAREKSRAELRTTSTSTRRADGM